MTVLESWREAVQQLYSTRTVSRGTKGNHDFNKNLPQSQVRSVPWPCNVFHISAPYIITIRRHRAIYYNNQNSKRPYAPSISPRPTICMLPFTTHINADTFYTIPPVSSILISYAKVSSLSFIHISFISSRPLVVQFVCVKLDLQKGHYWVLASGC